MAAYCGMSEPGTWLGFGMPTCVIRDCFQRPGCHIIPTGLQEALRFLWAESGLQKMQPRCDGHAEREAVLNPLPFYCHRFLPSLPAFLLLGLTPGYVRRPAHVRGGAGGCGRRRAARRRVPGRVDLITGPFQALGEGQRLEPLRDIATTAVTGAGAVGVFVMKLPAASPRPPGSSSSG
jgi:hypothetical protein